MSSSQSQAFNIYRDAKSLYEQRRYEEAAEVLNRASVCARSSKRRDDKALLWRIDDLRAASLSWSGDQSKKETAYEIAKSNCDKYGKEVNIAWKVLYRRADILVRLIQPNTAANVLNMARSHLSALPEPARQDAEKVLNSLSDRITRARREAQQRRLAHIATAEERDAELERQRLAALKSKKNYIQMLPRDVLLLVAQMGLRESPGFGVKMGLVCKEWRDLVHNTPGLWTELRLGKGSALSKAEFWLKRARLPLRSEPTRSTAKSSLRSVHIRETIDEGQLHGAVGLIAETASSVRSLLMHRHPRTYPDSLTGVCHAFSNLEYLSLSNAGRDAPCHRLDGNLLHNGYTGLRRLELSHMSIDFSARSLGGEASEVKWTSDPTAHLSGIRYLSIKHVDAVEKMNAVWQPKEDLLELMPDVEYVTLSDTNLHQINAPDQEKRNDFELPHLRFYAEACTTGLDLRFKHMFAPNLQHLCLYAYSHMLPHLDVVHQLQAPGLALAKANLQSLDIGRNKIDQAELLVALRDLPALRFLNVSLCGIDTNFVQALCRPETADDPGLLPNLTALSMIGHPDIPLAAIRDLVRSRLPPLVRMAEEARMKSKLQKTPKRSTLFGPTPAAKKSKPALAPTSSTPTLPSSSPAARASSSHLPSDSTHAPPSSFRPKLPSITWLNIDHCAVLEEGLRLWLNKHVRFVSNVFGMVDEDRMRGLKGFAWDGDWDEDCGAGSENKCQLRRDKSQPNAWYVHHVCDRRKAEVVVMDEAVTQSDGSLILGDGPGASKAREVAGW
ncbi:hypothetical protein BCR39DRAFT_549712 [Naematelia encephala]|uniref:F-box domain-containing protein n=1 Tax=Naematelia encephala TaxID=71784 RepID=A0A1Y2AL19_9TREE|nr:hypothetical protein BCR39DRAFT_549712 [Naematelia encephala]